MYQQILSILILIIITGYYFFFYKPQKQIKAYIKAFQAAGYKVLTFPYSPLKFPVHQTLFADAKKGDALMTYKTKYADYDVIIANSFANPIITYLSPEVRRQFVKKQIQYSHMKYPQRTQLLRFLFGGGLLTTEGDAWKRKRSILSQFLSYQFINSKVPQIYKVFESCLDQNQASAQKIKTQNKTQYSFELLKLTQKMTANIILLLVLGEQSLSEQIDGRPVGQFMLQFLKDYELRRNDFVPLIIGPTYTKYSFNEFDRRLRRRKSLFTEWINNYINKSMDKIKEKQSQVLKKERSNTMVQFLYRKIKKGDTQFTKQDLIDNLKIFFLAGCGTIAFYLQYMIYLSTQNQQIKTKAMKDFEKFDKGKSIENLKDLKYFQAFQKQAIRMYGPLPTLFPRLVARDHYFKDIPIKKGTQVALFATPTHFDQKYYKEPFEFKPERWLDNKQIDQIFLTGFGQGPRSCIGQYLAIIQSKIGYYCFFKRYSSVVAPKQIKYIWGFMYQIHGLNVKVVKN